jgi:hypothetical protein
MKIEKFEFGEYGIKTLRRTEYYDRGVLHREDGPAIIQIDGDEEWFYHGARIFCSNIEQFNRLIRLKAFW